MRATFGAGGSRWGLRRRPPAVAQVLAGALLAGAMLAPSAGVTAGPERPTPSGYPVPRYVTLKFGEVNARAGPGDDHRLLWVYRAKGLPVQVVAETSEWRRVCDPDGAMAWVHKRVTDGQRAVMNLGEAPAVLRRRPKAGAETAAFLNVRALATLDRCKDGWCRVKADGVSGWTPEGELWGTAAPPQCR